MFWVVVLSHQPLISLSAWGGWRWCRERWSRWPNHQVFTKIDIKDLDPSLQRSLLSLGMTSGMAGEGVGGSVGELEMAAWLQQVLDLLAPSGALVVIMV